MTGPIILEIDEFASRANEPNTPDTVDLNGHEEGATGQPPVRVYPGE